MTAATFGIVAAVIIGLIIIKWGTKKGHTSFLANYDDLPHELQTGLLPGDKRESMGESSCSSISIDSLTFNLYHCSSDSIRRILHQQNSIPLYAGV